MPQTSSRLRVGDRVTIRTGELAGELGVVSWSGKDGGCGCWSVFVRTDAGVEWYGKASEVEAV